MKRYLLFCTIALALAYVICLARNDDDMPKNLIEEPTSAPLKGLSNSLKALPFMPIRLGMLGNISRCLASLAPVFSGRRCPVTGPVKKTKF